MSDTALPGSQPLVSPALATDDENAGRLDRASSARLLAIAIALILFCQIPPLLYAMTGVLTTEIGAAFAASASSTSWALSILGVAGAATIALAGKVCDLWGKKRTLLLAGVFFLAGTLICAVTGNWAVFLVGRGLQAVCLSIPAVGYGVVRDLMPRRWIPVTVGLFATGLGVAYLAAPLIGGLLAEHYSWRSVFWFLLCYAAVCAAGLALIVPESRYRVRQRFDWPGGVLFGAGIAGVLVYLSGGTGWGWSSASSLAGLIGGLVVLALFAIWESRVSYPMMELSLLRTPRVWMLMAIAVFTTICLTLPSLTVRQMMQTPAPSALRDQVLAQTAAKHHAAVALLKLFVKFQGNVSYAAGFSVFQVAWHIIIWIALAVMVFGPAGGLLARRYGARPPLLVGTLALVASFELWTRFHGAWVDQAMIGGLAGAGFGLCYAALPNLLIDTVPAQRQGIGAGMMAVSGTIGSSLAIVLITPILAAHPYYLVDTPLGGRAVYRAVAHVYTNVGYSWAYLLLGGVPAVIGLILAYCLRSGRTPARGGAPWPAHPQSLSERWPGEGQR